MAAEAVGIWERTRPDWKFGGSAFGTTRVVDRNGRIACLATIIALAACNYMPAQQAPGRDAPAPVYRVGDRWLYAVEDGFRVKSRWRESHEIIAIGPAGITVRVTQKGDGLDSVRTEQLEAPGQIRLGALYNNETRRFATPLQRYNFPLRPGQIWNQWVDEVNETARTSGAINRYVVVGDWQNVSTPAGSFNAIRLRVLMRLDDDEFWRWPTTCAYRVWYAPDAGGVVREERDAGYLERGGPDPSSVWTQHAVVELIEFTRGGS